jgi:protein TonB
VTNPARRRERRLGWSAVAFAVSVNLLLFMALAWANTAPKRPVPARELSVREVFQAPPPPPPPPVDEAPKAAVESDPLPVEPVPVAADVQPEPFELRLDLPRLDLPAPTVSVPAPRLDRPAPALASPGILGAERADRPPRRNATSLPPYPAWARAARLEALVTLKLVVDAAGRVARIDVEAIEGDSRFGEIARQAVERWTYEPALLAGKPVPVVLLQRVRFQLVD